MDFSKLRDYGITKKQIEALTIRQAIDSQADIIFYSGAVRTGKSQGMIKDFILYAAEKANQGLENSIFLIVGFSVKQLKDAIVPIFENNLKNDFDYNDHKGEIGLFGNRALLMPGRQSVDYQRFRSYSAAGALINESTNIHVNTWNELLARLSEKGKTEPLLFADLNPASKTHFLYRRYFADMKKTIKKDGEILDWIGWNKAQRAVSFNFFLEDNREKNGGFLSDRYIERITSGLSGSARKNLVLGEWGTLENYVYDLDSLHFAESESSFNDESDYSTLQNNELVITSIDPAGAQGKESDFLAIITGVFNPENNKIRLLRSRMVRNAGANVSALDLIKDEVYTILETIGRIDILTIEADLTQDSYIATPIENTFRNRVLRVKRRRASQGGSKINRILACEDIIKKDVIFPIEWKNPKGEPEYNRPEWAGNLLIMQLCNIKYNGFDKDSASPESMLDGPDALEGLISETRQNPKEYGEATFARAR